MTVVITSDDLERNRSNAYFAGHQFGEIGFSFILVNMEPGEGVGLHSHPYEEVFIVQEGRATYTLIEDGTERMLEVTAGEIVIVPAHIPHAFLNTADGRLSQVDIHGRGQFGTQWLDDRLNTSGSE